MATDQKLADERRKANRAVLSSAAALALLLALLVAYLVYRNLAPKLTAVTYFSNSEGLKVDAPVTLNGVAIGNVKSVTISAAPERKKTPVQVVMRLNPKFQARLHTDSLAELVNLGALADTVVNINSDTATGPPLQDGDELKTLNMPSVLDLKATEATVRALNTVEGRFNVVVDDIESGKGSAGKFMSDPNLGNNVNATIKQAKEITAKLDSDNDTLGKALDHSDVPQQLVAASKDFQALGDAFTKRANGPLQAELDSTQAQLSALTADARNGKGSVGMLMDPNFKGQLHNTATAASNLSTLLKQKTGPGGAYGKGGEFDLNLTKFRNESSAVAAMIRTNPKKYLTIEVRVF